MSLESDIFTKLSTITEFKSVRYVVQDAGNDEQPQELPFCVFETGVKDYSDFATFCGVDQNFFQQNFVLFIFSIDTTEGQSLANASIAALAGTGVLTGIEIVFEPDLRCYLTTVSFS